MLNKLKCLVSGEMKRGIIQMQCVCVCVCVCVCLCVCLAGLGKSQFKQLAKFCSVSAAIGSLAVWRRGCVCVCMIECISVCDCKNVWVCVSLCASVFVCVYL